MPLCLSWRVLARGVRPAAPSGGGRPDAEGSEPPAETQPRRHVVAGAPAVARQRKTAVADDRIAHLDAGDGPRRREHFHAAADVERELGPVLTVREQDERQDAGAPVAETAAAGLGQVREPRPRLCEQAELLRPGAHLDAEERIRSAAIV